MGTRAVFQESKARNRNRLLFKWPAHWTQPEMTAIAQVPHSSFSPEKAQKKPIQELMGRMWELKSVFLGYLCVCRFEFDYVMAATLYNIVPAFSRF